MHSSAAKEDKDDPTTCHGRINDSDGRWPRFACKVNSVGQMVLPLTLCCHADKFCGGLAFRKYFSKGARNDLRPRWGGGTRPYGTVRRAQDTTRRERNQMNRSAAASGMHPHLRGTMADNFWCEERNDQRGRQHDRPPSRAPGKRRITVNDACLLYRTLNSLNSYTEYVMNTNYRGLDTEGCCLALSHHRNSPTPTPNEPSAYPSCIPCNYPDE